jgi:NADH-quinone oxidoreductase subunit G
MPTCTIDGKTVEFKPGQNLIEVARQAGIEIPYFCYHPGLSVVAQCRMCAIEIEKMPKLQTGCSTQAAEGMVVHTKSQKVKDNQKSVMEFLLINHPLDCPICDKAGECDLQDNSFKYGSPYMRYAEVRRTYQADEMGPVIKKNMNRCIHCTRCIRFADEIAGIREMVAIQRGNHVEITTVDGKPLETQYAANYSDICPTGSLTLKDFRFKKRVWYLKKTPSICEGCSRGCNLELHHEKNTLYRCMPRTNLEINKYWLCDEGRFNFHYVNDSNRITTPRMRGVDAGSSVTWSQAIEKTKASLKGKKVTLLVGTDLTQEELGLVQLFMQKHLPQASLFHFGTPGISTVSEDGDADAILKRKSKTSNLNGAEKLGLKPFREKAPGTEVTIVFRGGRAVLPELGSGITFGIGVFFENEIKSFEAILPGSSFAEKDGTVLNSQNKEQKFKKAIQSPGQCKGLSDIFNLWTGAHSSKEESTRVAL